MMTTETRRRGEGIVFLVLFALTIPLANWLIGMPERYARRADRVSFRWRRG
jgi:hypothetical protein